MGKILDLRRRGAKCGVLRRRHQGVAEPYAASFGKPQFKDPKVRKALYMACEMQKSIDDV